MTRYIPRLFVPLALGALAIGLIIGHSPSPAFADEVLLTANIDGPQAVKTCPQGSSGTGFGKVTYDTTTNLLSWNVTFGGLSGAAIDAHFHGPSTGPGENASITVPMTADLTSPSEGSATITEPEEADLLAGLWYINYHTAKCTGGEIRGQVEISVGGVAELPDVAATPLEESSASSSATIAALVTIAVLSVVTLGGGLAWYARRSKA